VEVNASRVKALRQQYQWTQQAFADLCSVSLRTVQRVEKTGNTSTETVMAMCAVFNIDQADLKVIPPQGSQAETEVRFAPMWTLLIAALMLGSMVGAGLMYWLMS